MVLDAFSLCFSVLILGEEQRAWMATDFWIDRKDIHSVLKWREDVVYTVAWRGDAIGKKYREYECKWLKNEEMPKGNNLYLSFEYEFIVFLSALIFYKQKKIHINLRSFITKFNIANPIALQNW